MEILLKFWQYILGWCYSDTIGAPKATWPNSLANQELVESWPCNEECVTGFEPNLVKI